MGIGATHSPIVLARKLVPPPSPSNVEKRLAQVEEGLDRVEAEVEIMRTQTRLMIQQSRVGMLDRFYLKGGLSIISPRPRTLDFTSQTGLGLFAGVGHYFGRHHVVDLPLDWDLFPSVTLRYRFELHSISPVFTWGPVLGFKTRAAEAGPLDNFLEASDRLRSSYYLLGLILGFPMDNKMFTLEILYLTNQQSFLVINGALHFFL